MEEAERVVQFWKRILPLLRQRAERAGLAGIACPAPMSPWGESPPKSREEILEERHFITANITLHVWQLYQYSGRLSVLRDYWECLRKPVEFLLGACVDSFPDHAEIIRSSGPNGKERVDQKHARRGQQTSKGKANAKGEFKIVMVEERREGGQLDPGLCDGVVGLYRRQAAEVLEQASRIVGTPDAEALIFRRPGEKLEVYRSTGFPEKEGGEKRYW